MPNTTKCSSQICARAAVRRVTSTLDFQPVARDLCEPCAELLIEISRILGATVEIWPITGIAEDLSFGELRAANTARLPLFRNRQGEIAHSRADGSDWSPADWLTAVVGEIGEAANLMKKLRRGDFVLGSPEHIAAYNDLAYELADVVIYLDILAKQLGVDLAAAVREKFNIVSTRVGADVKL